MDTTVISIDEVKSLCLEALRRKGALPHEADIVFDDYLDAELRGRASHGFSSFSVALLAFPHEGSYAVSKHSGSVIAIEGNGDCGHVVAREAIDLALETLGESKTCTIGIGNITRFNCPGSIARYAAVQGAIAIVLEYGGANFMIPHGGTREALSTNPLGIAIPGTDPLFVLDIATSQRAFGYVSLAKLAQQEIPATWGVDGTGKPTTDPNQLAAVSPFGGYKGYGLALAFEILSGALVQVPIGQQGQLSKRGALLMLFDPTIFGHSTQSFSEQVSGFLQELGEVPASDENVPVSYPGQRGEERYRRALKSGEISLHQSLIEQLRDFASRDYA